ncbi:MAG TPA: low molecular weight phosphatase family protein [Caulobacter sp.]|nr:low molecular weight phosphatase family protein [Caulobacter sp.]
MEGLPGAVLFACNFNRVRSPMAEALMRMQFGDRVFVDSVGLRREPGETAVDPFAAAVIDEIGGDLTDFRPKTFDDLEDESFDLVVSLTPEAQHRAVELARGRAVDIEYWPTLDPTLADGTREQRLEAYRQVRDELARRIRARFGKASTFGG